MTQTLPETIVLDVWGGENSTDHVARFIRPANEAIDIARNELHAGFLVNMRPDNAWGPEVEFDDRGRKQ